LAGSTHEICVLTDKGETATQTGYGMVQGDLGYSFEANGKVWWLFGDTKATATFNGYANASTRFPAQPQDLDHDAIATSAPVPAGTCPVLQFVQESSSDPVPGAYANPSVRNDPWPVTPGAAVSLQTNETPGAGISVDGTIYATFGTDNPADAGLPANCPGGGHNCLGRSTRSVVGEFEPTLSAPAGFVGKYDLSAPAVRYGDGAKFVKVALATAADGEIYIWGTAGGTEATQSPPYLDRLSPANIATGAGISYYSGRDHNGTPRFKPGEANAKALFHNHPDCMTDVAVQYNPYLDRWIMLYECPSDTPGGIYMRSAPQPWGPWSPPQVIYSPTPDPTTMTGYCYQMYQAPSQGSCPPGAPNPGDGGGAEGAYYAPYFVTGSTTGRAETATAPASSTFDYTLSTWDPYGEVIMETTLQGPAPVSVTTLPGRRPSPCPPTPPGQPIKCS
jgi:hypothetical protein